MANRLASETSPYLLQHAENPVEWLPWGEAAFERARREDKPIFLSIGYAACHWCHVMAHESFEDQATAAALNRDFIPVKVDREERPDVDTLYMEAVVALTGQGGWPLSVFLTPAGEPFYGGTYFPPARRHGLPSFAEVLQAISTAWRGDRGRLAETAARLTQHLARAAPLSAIESDIDLGTENQAMEVLLRLYDWEQGAGRSAEVPCRQRHRTAAAATSSPGRSAGAGDGDALSGGDGGRRDLRPTRGRLPPLRRRPSMDRSPLRENALRQRPSGAGVPRGLAGHRCRVFSPGRLGDPGFHAP
jgi:uncharacterized protein YyaL (SSP411 family)